MILVDANLLIYACVSSQPEHERTRSWLDRQLSGKARVGLPWPSLLAFVRLVSNPRVFEHPVSVRTAWRQVEDWLALEPVWIPSPTDLHAQILGTLIAHASGRAKLVPDCHLAALALEHGLILCSADGDFARFRGLRWENPLSHEV